LSADFSSVHHQFIVISISSQASVNSRTTINLDSCNTSIELTSFHRFKKNKNKNINSTNNTKIKQNKTKKHENKKFGYKKVQKKI